jgi:lipopolysaccharide export system ATP-binding protein
VVEDEDKRENMLEELLSEFSIAHLRKSPAMALSGGERRRLEIARALASQPNFILTNRWPVLTRLPSAKSDRSFRS